MQGARRAQGRSIAATRNTTAGAGAQGRALLGSSDLHVPRRRLLADGDTGTHQVTLTAAATAQGCGLPCLSRLLRSWTAPRRPSSTSRHSNSFKAATLLLVAAPESAARQLA